MSFLAEATTEEINKVISDAQSICQIPSATNKESSLTKHVFNKLKMLEVKAELEEGNAIAYFGSTDDKPILVAAHLDTVFDLDYISTYKEGDVIYGAGIGDNSLGLAGLLYLAKRAVTHDWANSRPLALVATVGEEGYGNLKGAIHVVDTLKPAEFIALEGGPSANSIAIRGQGSQRYKLSIKGKGGHSWNSRDTASSVHQLIDILQRLKAETDTMSFNVGVINGGERISAIASLASAEIEFRDTDDKQLLLNDIVEKIVEEETIHLGLNYRIDYLGSRPAGSTDANHSLVTNALDQLRQVGMSNIDLRTESTDANAAMAKNIPAIRFALGESANVHTEAESIDISYLPKTLTALGKLVDKRISQ